MAGWEIFTGRVSSAVRGVPFCPGVGSPIVASCLARPLSAPPFAVSSLDVIAASPIQPCRCPWNASSWTEPARRPKSIVCPGAQFRKNLWPLRNHRLELGFWGCRKSFRNWAPGGDEGAGQWHRDEIRNITGTVDTGTGIFGATGAFSVVESDKEQTTAGSYNSDFKFDASFVVPTGPQNVPPHVWQPVILYLGRPA